MVHNKGSQSATLTRFGHQAETLQRLIDQAKIAEQVIGIHGVSVRLNSKRKGKSALLDDVTASFPGTCQSGNDPKHYTVVLPKPVTQAVVDKFNMVFKP